MSRRLIRALLGILLGACTGQPALVRLERLDAGEGMTRLTLVAVPGARINARLKPALELADGRVLGFDGPDLTPDSSYFITSPAVELRNAPSPLRAILRASVCLSGEQVCRSVVLRL